MQNVADLPEHVLKRSFMLNSLNIFSHVQLILPEQRVIAGESNKVLHARLRNRFTRDRYEAKLYIGSLKRWRLFVDYIVF